MAVPVGVESWRYLVFAVLLNVLLCKKTDLYKQLIDADDQLNAIAELSLRRHVAGLTVCLFDQLCTMPGLMLFVFRGKLLGSGQVKSSKVLLARSKAAADIVR